MPNKKKEQEETSEKTSNIVEEKVMMHPRNKHRSRYDFKELISSAPELERFVKPNKYGDESIDFFDPAAVVKLNTALLKHYYNIKFWRIPKGYLCPPIPGRADYIHYMADVLENSNFKQESRIKCLDIGLGASCVYPIIGINEYNWSFIGSEIDPVSIESVNKIIELNPTLQGKLAVRLQKSSKDIFFGIIKKDEKFDLSICNPPFHSSLKEAELATMEKLKKLKKIRNPKIVQNFGGNNKELWCEGGEERFLNTMIRQSRQFSKSVFWFSTMVSKQANLKNAYKTLRDMKAAEVKTIPMGQGNKVSRIIAWTFLSPEHQMQWVKSK